MSGNGQESTAQHEEQERKQREFNHQVAERSTDMAHAMDRARDVGGVIHNTYDREMYSREGASVRDIGFGDLVDRVTQMSYSDFVGNYINTMGAPHDNLSLPSDVQEATL